MRHITQARNYLTPKGLVFRPLLLPALYFFFNAPRSVVSSPTPQAEAMIALSNVKRVFVLYLGVGDLYFGAARWLNKD